MSVIRHLPALLGLLLLASACFAQAQSGAGYEIRRSTIDSGGGTSSDGTSSLTGTIGQFDAGAAMTAAGYELRPGFWGSATASVPNDTIFRNGFEPATR